MNYLGLLATVVLATTPIFGAVADPIESDFSAVVAFDTAYEVEDSAFQKMELIVMPELGIDFGDISMTTIGRIRFDGENRLEPREPQQRAVAPGSQRHFLSDVEIELRELFLDIPIGSAYLRLGKQQVVWGQADGLKVLDVVNPQSFREFILDEFEDSRISLWTVNLELPLARGTLQLLWVPDQTYNDLPERAATFEITALFTDLSPGIPVTFAALDVPDRIIADSDAGLRYAWFSGGWDLTLNYFYHYNDLPVIRRQQSSAGLLLKPSYERTHLLGGTIANVFGDFTVRGEFGYSSDSFFATEATEATEATAFGDGIGESGELSSVVGIDFSGIRDTLVSGQLFQSTILNHKDAMQRSQIEVNASLLVRRTFANETIEAQLLWIQSLSGDGAIFRPRIGIDYSTRWKIEIYADYFDGDQLGLFGQFDSRDRIGFTVTLSL